MKVFTDGGGKLRIGFLVNPIAGMGGSVGLKGTDGDLYVEALRRGAKPVSPLKARRFLKSLSLEGFESTLLLAGGVMGCNYLSRDLRLNTECIDYPNPALTKTSADDTRRVVAKFLDLGVDVVVFVGGDGTARDVGELTGMEVPVIGVPAGVKMYSGVFAASPEAAARIIKDLEDGAPVSVMEDYVADINEDMLREGVIGVRKFIKVLTIKHGSLTVGGKDFRSSGSLEEKYEVARYFIEEYLRRNTLYLLGPGSTVKAVTDILNLRKTLLGVDALLNNEIIASDIGYREILNLLNRFDRAKIVITVIGGQGYLFGRGNQQFTPEVIRRVGGENIVVLATRTKLSNLKYLLVDTGDPVLDRELSGYIRVLTGYREERVMPVLPASDPESLRRF